MSGVILAYWLGGDSFIETLFNAFADDSPAAFTEFMFVLAVASIVAAVATCFVISDAEDTEGLFGKGNAMTYGVLYKRFGYFYFGVLIVYSTVLFCALQGSNL